MDRYRRGSPPTPLAPLVTLIRAALVISSMRGGGSEQQTLLLAQHLPRDRFDVSLFLQDFDGDLLERVPRDVATLCFGATTPRVYFPGRMFRRSAANLRNLTRRHSIDVLYDRTFNMTMVAAAAVDRIGIPRVSTIVSPPDVAVASVEKRFVGLKRRRLAAAYRSSSAVIAVSAAAADSAAAYYGLPRDRIQTIANPVDTDRLTANLATHPADDAGRRHIVVVGRMTAEKGHRDFLHAAATMDDSQWQNHGVRFVGDGPLRPELEDLSRTLGLSTRVQFVGPLPEAAREIASARMLVLPSHFEGMPNVVLEAMVLGTPVVATDVGGTPQLCPDPDRPTMLLVPPRCDHAMAAAITRLLGDRTLAERLRSNARSHVAKHHNVASAVNRIAECLHVAATR